MAGYREHISINGILGIGFGASAFYFFEFSPVQAMLAGILTWIAGMFPDLDSESGKPVREIFGLLAAITPLAMMGHLLKWGSNPEEVTCPLWRKREAASWTGPEGLPSTAATAFRSTRR